MRLIGLDNQPSMCAVALSGGADSTALTHAILSAGIETHALIVDHGLRPESAREATLVHQRAIAMGCKSATILQWDAPKPTAAIQEQARTARYALLAVACHARNIPVLALGHTLDDQAETILFRLAKGSGLDGLAGMPTLTAYDAQLQLWRPLLQTTHAEIVTYCKNNKLDWVEDPSNQNIRFARPRLRAALNTEGTTAKRLSITAMRLRRAREALEIIATQAIHATIIHHPTHTILRYTDWRNYPADIRLRVLQHMFNHHNQIARMDALERLETGLFAAKKTQHFDLANLDIYLDRKNDAVSFTRSNRVK